MDAEELAQADYQRHQAAIENAIAEANAAQITLAVGSYERTIKQRPVTFTCEWCGEEATEMRYPGPPPRYHEGCKTPAQNSIARNRMKALRQRQAEQNPARRPAGRPKSS